MQSTNVYTAVKFACLRAVAVVFLMTLAAAAAARQNPCAEDEAKLCKGVHAGEGRIAQCLKQQAQELSPACREFAVEVKEKIHDFASACKEDTTRLCQGVKPGGGRLLQCLKQHETELSAACREKMAQARGKKP